MLYGPLASGFVIIKMNIIIIMIIIVQKFSQGAYLWGGGGSAADQLHFWAGNLRWSLKRRQCLDSRSCRRLQKRHTHHCLSGLPCSVSLSDVLKPSGKFQIIVAFLSPLLIGSCLDLAIQQGVGLWQPFKCRLPVGRTLSFGRKILILSV